MQIVQRRFGQLRFVSYIGVQMVSIITPLLVYKLTHSLSMAGLALLAEWLPKLGFYFASGVLVQTLGLRRALLGLNIVRLVAFILLTLVVTHIGSLALVALAAALYQCANAVSNVLFETAVTSWWHADERASGYTRLMKFDQLGCVAALTLGLWLADPLLLCLIGGAVQLACLLLVSSIWKQLSIHTSPTQMSLRCFTRQLGADLTAVRQRDLLTFSAASMLIAMPVCCLFSMLVFYLNRAQPGLADGAQILSLVLLGKALIGSGVLAFMQKLLSRDEHNHRIGLIGMIMVPVGTFMALLPLGLWPAIALLLVISAGWLIYQPWMRTLRQELVMRHVPAPSRAGVTGILISMEAASYLAVGGLLYLSHNQLEIALLCSALLASLGIAWRFSHSALAPVRSS